MALEGVLVDVARSVRGLRRAPVFAATAALTLTLGLGASTAIFAVAAAVLEPLPYGDPGHLAMVWSRWRNFDKTWVNPWEMTAYKERCPSIEEVAYWGSDNVALTGDGDATA